MKTRILRSVALLLPLLFIALWLISGFFSAGFSYMRADPVTDAPKGIQCDSSAGAFYIACGPRSGTWPLGWDYGHYPLPHLQFWPPYISSPDDSRFLGFDFYSFEPDSAGFSLQIPYWFPTLLALLISLLIWKKTKPKTPSHAFPIHPTTSPSPTGKTAPIP